MNAIKNIVNIPLFLPIPIVNDEKHEAIKKIAIAALKELVFGLAFTGVACLFGATPVGIALAIGSVVAMVAVNVLFRGMALSFSKRLCKIEVIQTPAAIKEKKFLRAALDIYNLLCASTFSIVYLGTAATVVHETGHAVAASLLTNGSVSITVNPFRGGVTNYFLSKLSTLGHYFGLKETKLIISAAGAAFTLITSLTFFVIGHYIARSHPKLAVYLNMIGVVGILQETLYAMQALSTQSSSSHDFWALRQGGVHPLVSVTFLIGLPLLVKGMLILADHLLKHPSQVASSNPVKVENIPLPT